MSTILFFTSDRVAFASGANSANPTESIILTPDQAGGNRLHFGNSTMITYDAGSNIQTINENRAALTIDAANQRVGINAPNPQFALDIGGSGLRVSGPANLAGNVVIGGTVNTSGNVTVGGTLNATSFTGLASGLTAIPASRLVGTLPSSVYGTNTIPIAALSGAGGGPAGNFNFSGTINTDFLNAASSISTALLSANIVRAGTLIGNLATSNLTGTLPTPLFLARTIPINSLITFGTITIENVSSIFISSQNIGAGSIYSQLMSTNQAILNILTVGSIQAEAISTNFISSGFMSQINTSSANLSSLRYSESRGNQIIASSAQLSTVNIQTLNVGTISSSQLNLLLTTFNTFDTLSVGSANISSLAVNTISANTLSISTITTTNLNSQRINSDLIQASTLSTQIIQAGTARVSSIQTRVLSTQLGLVSTLVTSNVYVTNIYANGGDQAVMNIIASSMNASRAVFCQVIASSFHGNLQGDVYGKNILDISTY